MVILKINGYKICRPESGRVFGAMDGLGGVKSADEALGDGIAAALDDEGAGGGILDALTL